MSRKHTDDLRALSYVQNKQREEQRDTESSTGPPLSLFPWYGSPSLYLSLVNPFTVIRAFQRFLFFCRSELWEIISVRLLADFTQKAALESGFLLLQRLKSSGWLFFFFPLPRPTEAHIPRHTVSEKKQKRGGMTYRKQKNPPVLWFHSPSGPEKILTLNPEQQP